MSVFKTNNVVPPTTVAELMTVCTTLKAAGVTPIALATGTSNGWIVREMFNAIVQGTMGSSVFKDFVTAAKPVTDPTIATPLKMAIHTTAQILTQYINSDAAPVLAADGGTVKSFGWTDAADEVKAGKAVMYTHGDWVKGYWEALGWTPAVDFGQSGALGAFDLFSYGIDVLSTPTSAPDPTSASAFLTVAVSGAGQGAFSKQKGSSPARVDAATRDLLDPLGQATLDDLVNAKVRLPAYGLNAWDAALGVFSASPCAPTDEETLYQVYVANPPVAAP